MMSQVFQETLLKESPCVVVTPQGKRDVFTNLIRKKSRRDLSLKTSQSFENEFTSVWSTSPYKTSRENVDANNSSRKNTSVVSSILMRRAPSIVFEDVGGVPDQLWACAPPPPSPQMSGSGQRSYSSETSRAALNESTLNSLECWDYSVELECLSGPDGRDMQLILFIWKNS